MRHLAWVTARPVDLALSLFGTGRAHRYVIEAQNYIPHQMGLPLIEDPSVPLKIPRVWILCSV